MFLPSKIRLKNTSTIPNNVACNGCNVTPNIVVALT